MIFLGISGLNCKLSKIGLSLLSLISFIAFGAIPLITNNQYAIRLAITGLMYGTLAMGFDLSAGFINVPNWGYGALMGLGAYISALININFNFSPWITMILGGFAAAFIGFIIAAITMRMEGVYTALLSWFVGLILMAIIAATPDITRGNLGLSVPSLFQSIKNTNYFYTIFVICVSVFIVLRIITRSNLGAAFKALGQDTEAARSSGISPFKYRTINFVVSCFIAGLVGGFYAHFVGVLTPNLLNTTNTITILVYCYIGGRGSIWGPLIASIIITPLFESMNWLFEWKYIIYGSILILIMIYAPDGIAGFSKKSKIFVQNKIDSRR